MKSSWRTKENEDRSPPVDCMQEAQTGATKSDLNQSSLEKMQATMEDASFGKVRLSTGSYPNDQHSKLN